MRYSIPGTARPPHHDIQIRKGGRIVRMEWDDAVQRHVELLVPPSDFAGFLDAAVCVADEVSLRDIMVMIEKGRELFAETAACDCIADLLDEMRSEAERGPMALLPVMLDMAWSAIVMDGTLQILPLFAGRTADGQPVDLAFMTLSWIADLPVLLDERFIIVDDEDPEKAVFVSKRMMTLRDVVKGILDELTQLGNPAEKRQTVEELRDVMQQVEKGYTIEEVMEHAALQAEEARKKFPCRVCGEDSRCACFGKPSSLCHDCFANMREN